MKLRYTRYCVRGNSGLMSITATAAAVESARLSMRNASWQDMGELGSDLPPHKYEQVGVKMTYDAYMYGGDYVADSTQCQQRAYCGAVCYSFPLPSDALDTSNPCTLSSLSLRVYGDRWLSQGAMIDVFFSANSLPPNFSSIEDGTAVPTYTTGTPAAADAENPAFPPPLQCVVRSNSGSDSAATLSLPVAHALLATDAYMHVVLRLANYTHLEQTNTGATSTWIEGSAAIVGSLADITFSRAVGAVAVLRRPAHDTHGWDIDSENAAAYSFRHFVFDYEFGNPHANTYEQLANLTIDENLLQQDMDCLHYPEFPLAGVIRNTFTPASNEVDWARPFYFRSGLKCMCGMFGLSRPYGISASDNPRYYYGYYSGLCLNTFVTKSRRYRGLRFNIQRMHGNNPGDQTNLSCDASCGGLLRIDAFALPWPLLVFPKASDATTHGDCYMAFAQFVDISSLLDPGFLSGVTSAINFVSDPDFYTELLDHPDTMPAFKAAGSSDLEHSLFASTAFPCAPLVSTVLDFSGISNSETTQDIQFPVPLDSPEKTVVLLHARIVSQPHTIYGEQIAINPQTMYLLEGE